jgi:hypothetical protein
MPSCVLGKGSADKRTYYSPKLCNYFHIKSVVKDHKNIWRFTYSLEPFQIGLMPIWQLAVEIPQRHVKDLRGRLLSGVELLIISSAPFKIPAAPTPDTALPTINIVELVARPQSSEPSSKIPRKTKNIYLRMKS